MIAHRLHDENGNFLIRKEGDSFYLHTDGGGGGSGTPGLVQSFFYLGNTPLECVGGSGNINFTWSAPYDNGGSPITGYSLRRIEVVSDPASTEPGGYWSGNSDVVETSFYYPCPDDVIPDDFDYSNPITVGNITSTGILDWQCGYYSFQIAAINVNGTGEYTPTNSDFDNVMGIENLGWTRVGTDNLTISVGATIDVSIDDSLVCGVGKNYQNTSGNLYDVGATLVSTYSSFSEGSLQFANPGSGWYYVANVYETCTDYTNSNQQRRDGCLIVPFYVSGSPY
jgi:hypothetical protein